VHGIGNKPIASILKCQWDTALFGFDLGDRSRLAYWVNRERFPDPEAGSCASGDLSDGDDAEAPAGPGAQSVGDEKNWLEADIAALAQNTEQRDLLRKLAADMTTKAASGPDKTARQVGAKVLPLPAFMAATPRRET
jgi:hypothetical protein